MQTGVYSPQQFTCCTDADFMGYVSGLLCEQYVQKETELKATVEDLEKQVADTKRKCDELSSRVELLRRQKLLK
ncbi:hypothetical protein QVD17_25068 [Tagetes erecta]|uniref:Uncharacterized protein n=1 Tax=Tagetes erecta TaxID=13708 RepID=A0AAD8NV41_TARER|nr:hypothetical protein QVD17_25068 [Tagetes erecta]